MTSITAYNVNDPTPGLQRFIRSTGSFLDDGFTGAHRVTIEGFTNAVNNKIRVGNASPSDTQLNTVTTTGVAEAATGDERIRGVIGNLPQTLSIRRAASGLTYLDVANLGGGRKLLLTFNTCLCSRSTRN